MDEKFNIICYINVVQNNILNWRKCHVKIIFYLYFCGGSCAVRYNCLY